MKKTNRYIKVYKHIELFRKQEMINKRRIKHDNVELVELIELH
jgi:hypothetical protein